MINIKDALSLGKISLKEKSDSPQVDTEILLSYIFNCKKAYLYTHPERVLTENEYSDYLSLLNERKNGVPIAYLTGVKEFWSLPLQVSKSTLIPRPETELLVEKTLDILDATKQIKLLELGTGSGAIAIAIAVNRPNWQIWAIEKNHEALDVAIKNAEKLGIKNIKFVLSDWFYKIDKLKFHAIIANPPYIAENDPHLLEGDVSFEPRYALISGTTGLESLQYIIEQSYDYLLIDGILLLEHGYNQKKDLEKILSKRGYLSISCFKDLQGHDRVSLGVKGKVII